MKSHSRTALLICCSEEEASKVHEEAKIELRTVSGYVLSVVMRAVQVDEKLFAKFSGLRTWNLHGWKHSLRLPGPRTAMLIRCSKEQSTRIRMAAKRRDMTVSGLVLSFLIRSWLIRQTTGLDVSPPSVPKPQANRNR